jgi:hypothetical protein
MAEISGHAGGKSVSRQTNAHVPYAKPRWRESVPMQGAATLTAGSGSIVRVRGRRSAGNEMAANDNKPVTDADTLRLLQITAMLKLFRNTCARDPEEGEDGATKITPKLPAGPVDPAAIMTAEEIDEFIRTHS